MTEMLLIVLAAVGTLGSVAVGVLWGGWSQPMTVLCIMMALDYVSGVVVALVFRKSPKTETGGMSSVIGFKGLLRKLFLILLVAAAYQVDRMIGTNYIRDAVAIAFIANEALSLLENAGLMGIPIPKVLLRGIDVLKGKETAEAAKISGGKLAFSFGSEGDGVVSLAESVAGTAAKKEDATAVNAWHLWIADDAGIITDITARIRRCLSGE